LGASGAATPETDRANKRAAKGDLRFSEGIADVVRYITLAVSPVALLFQMALCTLPAVQTTPEFNPIEHAWAKMKERLKAKAARTLEALEAELKPALDTITAMDAKGWIRHAGYALH